MLVVPFVVAVARTGLSAAQVALFVAWLAGYFLFNAAGLWLRSGRRASYRLPLLVYGALTALAGAVVVVLRPDLVRWAVAYLPLALISLAYSRRRKDRALGNDAVTIAAAALFAAVTYDASAAGINQPGLVSWLVAALFAYFFGTSLYVKTIIRERANPAYHLASVAYHAAWALVWVIAPALGAPMGAGTHAALVAFFAVLTVRAAVLAGQRAKPMHVGLGEMAASAAILAVCITW